MPGILSTRYKFTFLPWGITQQFQFYLNIIIKSFSNHFFLNLQFSLWHRSALSVHDSYQTHAQTSLKTTISGWCLGGGRHAGMNRAQITPAFMLFVFSLGLFDIKHWSIYSLTARLYFCFLTYAEDHFTPYTSQRLENGRNWYYAEIFVLQPVK